MKFNEGLRITGHVTLVHKDSEGNIKGVRSKKNLVVKAGYAAIAALIGYNLGGSTFRYIGLGTDDTAADAADTDLGTQSGDKQTATVTTATVTETDDAAQFVATQAFTGTVAVTEAGLFNNSTAATGDMLARQVFSALNVVSGDSIETTWKVKVSTS